MNAVTQLISDRRETIASNGVFQTLYSAFTLVKYAYSLLCKRDSYAAYVATLGYERVAASVKGWRLSPVVCKINSSLITSIKACPGKNPLVDSYLTSAEAARYRSEFRMYGWAHQVRLRYPREHDDPARQGDLLILKPYMSSNEKGVILVQYNDSFKKFVSVFDLDRVARCYRIVLEPSTWGYCDAAILFFLNANTDVIVEAQYGPDYKYIQSIDTNFTPLRIGAGDWADEDRFKPRSYGEKIYDIVMVASWQRIKRHELLFAAMRKCRDVVKKVALIGYPSGGRSSQDILREAGKYGVQDRVDIYENISRAEVSRIIGQSKIGVMLTVREGANKGIYECFFSGVPVIISDDNIGVNREHINKDTGLAARDEDLPERIASVLANVHSYAPCEWALRTTGYRNSTRILNDCLRRCATKAGEKWTQDIFAKKNDTNAMYVREEDRIAADDAAKHLRVLLRE